MAAGTFVLQRLATRAFVLPARGFCYSHRSPIAPILTTISQNRRFGSTATATSHQDGEESSSSHSSPQQHHHHQHRRRLDIAVVGLPNAGKSQLLNVLCGTTVSAVSRKRHTTREGGILGAYTTTSSNDNNNNHHQTDSIPTQLVFADTPGFLKSDDDNALDPDLNLGAPGVEQSFCDYTLLVVDAAVAAYYGHKKDTIVQLMMQALESTGRLETVTTTTAANTNNNENDEAADCVVETLVSPSSLLTEGEDGAADANISHHHHHQHRDLSKFAIVLNKVDLVHPKTKLMDMAMELETIAAATIQHVLVTDNEEDKDNDDESDETAIQHDGAGDKKVLLDRMPMFFYVSALKNDGVDDLREFLLDRATPTSEPWVVMEDSKTNLEPLEQVEEIIREKLYRCLHKEVPYNVRQANRVFKVGTSSQSTPSKGAGIDRGHELRQRQHHDPQQQQHQPTLLIHQDLIVRTASHQKLLLGQTLERIRSTAERDIAKRFSCRVFLQLHVKLPRSRNKRWSI